MHFSTELSYKVNVSFELFASDCIEVISQQNSVGILSWTESEQEFTKFESSPVATFSTQYVDVLQQTFAECFV